MNHAKSLFLLLAVAASAVAAVAVASTMGRRQRRGAHDLEHAGDLKSWENEGGNLAPSLPAVASR